jgi:signal recognition particle GTPase
MPKSKKDKHFVDAWMLDKEFCLWIEKVANDTTVCKCKACNKILKCGRSELRKHSISSYHVDNMTKLSNSTSRQQKLDTMYSTYESERKKQAAHDTSVKDLELSLCAFFAEHNVALSIVDHLGDLLKKKIPDSKITADLQLKRTKCTALIKNVLAKHENNLLITDLQKVIYLILFILFILKFMVTGKIFYSAR